MVKIVKDSHATGEQGVVLFSQYCAEHKPMILFKEVLKHDFGIDGELELTRKTQDGKVEACAEILKVQIKSVNSDNSYIQNESKNSFDYYATKDDLDYWLKYEKHGMPVLLVIVDLRTRLLYAKRIAKLETFGSKKKKLPIRFDKLENQLVPGKNDFPQKFSTDFRTRINFDTSETLLTNALQVKKFPKLLYKNISNFETKKEIFAEITGDDAPHFALKGTEIYSFREIAGADCDTFIKKVVKENKNEPIPFKNILESLDLTNIYLELFYTHLKHELKSRGLSYSKDYKRYYFPLPEGKEGKTITIRTRKKHAQKEKKVVTKHTYTKTSFYRHYALEFKVKIFEGSPQLIINPKYLFTSDGRKTLPPRKITKYTNFLTAREYNNVYADLLHLWKDFLFKGADELKLFASNESPILISDFTAITVPFGIALDKRSRDKKKLENNNEQMTISL